MKSHNIILLALLAVATVSAAQTQEKKEPRPLRIGDVAPSFVAQSTRGDINFPSDYGLKWKILFSHPADFTPVCSSELMELAQLQNKCIKMNVGVAVISTDNLETHESWKKSMESIHYKGRDPVSIEFPLIDDHSWHISNLYGMVSPESPTKEDIRGVFIIDPYNKLQAIFYYPMNIGRNYDEILRTVEALQTASNEKVLTPANWKPGDDVMLPFARNEKESKAILSQNSANTYAVSWYMLFKKMK